MKKIGLFLLIVFVLGGAAYFLMPSNSKTRGHSTEGVDLIPKDAFLMVKSSDFSELVKDAETNQVFSTLLEVPGIRSGWEQSKYLDSILTASGWLKTKSKSIHLSMHMTGKTSYAPLIVIGPIQEFSLPKNQKLKGVNFKDARIYEETDLVTLEVDSGNQQLFSAKLGDFCVLSSSPVLVETAVRNYKYDFSLLKDEGFRKLLRTSDPQSDANLFINYTKIPRFLEVFTPSNNSIVTSKLNHFGNWMEVDLTLKSSGIMLNGFSAINDSNVTFLNAFKGLSPQKFNASSVLPNNTAYVSYMGWSSFDQFYKGYLGYLNTIQELYTHESNIEKINKKYDFDVQEDVFSWIGKEMTVFISEGNQEDVTSNMGLAIHVKDIEELDSHLERIRKSTGADEIAGEYLNYAIGDLKLTNLFPMILGDAFNGVEESFYVVIEDYIIFANDIGNIKHIINSYLRGSTLIKSIHYNKFMENLSDLSNYFVYYNFKRGQNFPDKYLAEPVAGQYKSAQDSLKNLNAFALQVIQNNNLFFTNGYIEYKKIEENKTISLIECKLDTSYSVQPWVVVNHYTKEKEILVQDNLNQLYLINNVGKVLWKKKLDGKIIGEVYQVDRYKNDKLQYLFGTGKSLQLIDRLGHHVDGFPSKLKQEQTQGIAVLDYDKNRSYRILVPAGREILNYSIEGKVVGGWEFKSSKNDIACAPKLLQNNKKDYIIVVDNGGNVRALNRKGEDRLDISARLPKGSENYSIWSNSTLSNSAAFGTDTNGTVFMLKLNNELDPITLRAFSSNHVFSMANITGQGKDMVFFDESKIYGYSLSKKKIFEVDNIDFPPKYGVQVHNLKEYTFISVSDINTRKCYFYDTAGNLLDGFPVEAVSPALVEDVDNDGRFELIVGDQLGSMYFYSIFQ